MNEQLVEWIIRFQRDKDIEALANLKDYCYEMIEPLIMEFTAKYGEGRRAITFKMGQTILFYFY